ncbi:MAG: 50S ribosomal protein L6 [Woeseiaceae bacterium]|nr:50S ribosomal protein L6 [Woeseiaceae bacterium]MDG1712755.1 50S ribosomal protein L6 [Woeseiaceae bacterium]
MSRIAKEPVNIPKDIEFSMSGLTLTLKGAKGSLSMDLNPEVNVEENDSILSFAPKSGSKFSLAISGTTRALVANMVHGVSQGFEKKLELVGVGYRAQAQGKKLNLTLGFSHPVVYEVPEGVTIETPSQTEILVKGIDKQSVGQVAAEIRHFRPPEPYKGKGVRYADEHVVMKEAKKK